MAMEPFPRFHFPPRLDAYAAAVRRNGADSFRNSVAVSDGGIEDTEIVDTMDFQRGATTPWSMLFDSRAVPHLPPMMDLLQSDGICTGRSILLSGARVPAG